MAATPALVAGQWSHVAAVYDGAAARLFVNGVASPALTLGTRTADAFLRLGGLSGYPYFTGALDEVRLSRTARYAADFSPAARLALEAATLGLWHLDEGAGQTALDASAAGNHLTLGLSTAAEAGDPAWSPTGR